MPRQKEIVTASKWKMRQSGGQTGKTSGGVNQW